MIKIILVDDHHLVREGVKSLIYREKGLQLLAEAEHSACLAPLLEQHGSQAQLLLLDVNMSRPPRFYPELEIPDLMVRYPQLRVLILSGDDRVAIIQKMMAAGANGYVLKDTLESLAELARGIRIVCAGGRFYSRRVLQLLLEANPKIVFSPREADVARLLVKGSGNKSIAAKLYISEKYVEKLISIVGIKVGVPDRDNAGFPLNTRAYLVSALKEMGY
jgi:DNA-binding NarL/FixJ family response regulator